MTTPGRRYVPHTLPEDATAVLVRGPRPARPTVDRVAVSPRPCATCDGDRWHLPLVVRVVAGGDDRRRQFPRERLQSAVDAVRAAVRERGVGEVWFYRTHHLGDYWSAGTVARLEECLAGVARGSGGRFVTWTGVEDGDHRRERYDLVVE